MIDAKHIPTVRCYSCGKVMARIITQYHKDIEDGYTLEEAKDRTGLMRMCCLRTVLSSYSPRQLPATAMFERQTPHYQFVEPKKTETPRHVRAE